MAGVIQVPRWPGRAEVAQAFTTRSKAWSAVKRKAPRLRVRATYDARQVSEERLSSVQYLKFDVKGQVPVAAGADLPALTLEVALTPEQRAALRQDLAAGT